MITERQRDERELRILNAWCEGVDMLRLKIAGEEGVKLDVLDTILSEHGLMQDEMEGEE